MTTAGYSGTPMAKKLGIKPGFSVQLIHEPAHYLNLFADLPPDIIFNAEAPLNFIHFFTKDSAELNAYLPQLKEKITCDGIIWVSWPKKASKIVTDVTEDAIRNLALGIGLVDVKVCAVDEVWSALKLVIPLKYR